MSFTRKLAALAAAGMISGALVAAPDRAGAAVVTVGIQSFGNIPDASVNIVGAQAAQAAFHAGSALVASENFEGFAATPAGVAGGSAGINPVPSLGTAVGTFSFIAPTNGTCIDSCVTPKNALHVRSAVYPSTNFGRYNTSAGVGDKNFLDSNDTGGIKLVIPGAASLGAFDRISFMATDIDDVGSVAFQISVSGTNLTVAGSSLLTTGFQKNGTLNLFTFVFDSFVTDVTIKMKIDSNDGFGVDSFVVSAVPLPAAAWLMLAGLGGLGLMSRRRAA
jgi:hypothetical protein